VAVEFDGRLAALVGGVPGGHFCRRLHDDFARRGFDRGFSLRHQMVRADVDRQSARRGFDRGFSLRHLPSPGDNGHPPSRRGFDRGFSLRHLPSPGDNGHPPSRRGFDRGFSLRQRLLSLGLNDRGPRRGFELLRVQGAGIRQIARQIGRDPSTISRELRRNAATRGGKLDYRASVAQWKAELVARRPKTAKLVKNSRLQHYVQERLSGQIRRPDRTPVAGPATGPWTGRNKPHRGDRRWVTGWSPEQIANRLKVDFPDDESMPISHEAIYQALYVESRGALKRELILCLRTGRALRAPRARAKRTAWAHVTPEVLISERPAEVADRAVPGALGRRPAHRARAFSDQHPGGTLNQIHHADPPAPAGGVRGRPAN
jgi:Helix-turn-helix domain